MSKNKYYFFFASIVLELLYFNSIILFEGSDVLLWIIFFIPFFVFLGIFQGSTIFQTNLIPSKSELIFLWIGMFIIPLLITFISNPLFRQSGGGHPPMPPLYFFILLASPIIILFNVLGIFLGKKVTKNVGA